MSGHEEESVDRAPAFKAKPFFVAWCLCFLVMVSAGVLFLRSRAPLDFQSFYTAGYQVRTHPSQLYDLSEQWRLQREFAGTRGYLPFYHPAYETLLFLPFSLLSYHAAYFCFLAFNMLLLLAAFFACRKAFSSLPAWWGGRPEWVFLFFPMLVALALGQDSVLSLVLYCLAWRQLEFEKDVSAGCLLALALFKFHFAIPVAVLVAIRQGWRFCSGFLLTAVAMGLTSIGITGISGTAQYVRILSGATSAIGKSAVAQQHLNVFPQSMPNLTGLLYAAGGRFLNPAILFHLLTSAVALCLFAWCAYAIRRCEQRTAFSIAVLWSMVVSYHLYFYDLTLSILPAALLTGKAYRPILIVWFVLPALLFGLGSNWYFFMAVPMLAMLAYALVYAPGREAPAPETTRATAA